MPSAAPARLEAAHWMSEPRAVAVFDALEAAGGPDCARYVGGCVRNALLGAPVDDVDIATRLEPPAVAAALARAGLRAVPTGLEHGTVTAISGSRPYEITTLRRDVATDGRRAVVAFTTDWREDALRRDFTLNALYARRDGRIEDPVGCGVQHARAGRIVFVGEPDERIREDYLRILRFFRFLAWYGRGEPDAAGLAACAANRQGLARLAAERISKELLKLLAARDPRASVGLMHAAGVLQCVLPEASDLRRFEALCALSEDPLLRLAALLPDRPDGAADAARRLRLSNAQRDRLVTAATAALHEGLSDVAARAAVYRLGRAAVADATLLAWARDGREAVWGPVLEIATNWAPPVLPVAGGDALAAGIARGPAVGEALAEVEAWWIAHDFPPDREAALARLKAVAQARSD